MIHAQGKQTMIDQGSENGNRLPGACEEVSHAQNNFIAMNWSRLSLAIFFLAAGIGHLVSPNMYLAIIPSWVPWPTAMVTISGWAEICGGIGVLPRLTRRWAGWGLIALLVAVFPANVHALFAGMSIAGHAVPIWLLWARLPLQLLLIFWVQSACLARKNSALGTRSQHNAYGSESHDGVDR
jgi:uncharacterized membrane protein